MPRRQRARAQVRAFLNRRREEADREGEQHEAAECIDGYVQRTGHWANNSRGIVGPASGSAVPPHGNQVLPASLAVVEYRCQHDRTPLFDLGDCWPGFVSGRLRRLREMVPSEPD
jgi:hypothetical protein